MAFEKSSTIVAPCHETAVAIEDHAEAKTPPMPHQQAGAFYRASIRQRSFLVPPKTCPNALRKAGQDSK